MTTTPGQLFLYYSIRLIRGDRGCAHLLAFYTFLEGNSNG